MRNKFKCALLLALAGLPAMGAEGFIINGVAATVNGEAVTIGEARMGLEAQIAAMSKEPGFSGKSREEVFKEAMRRNTDELVNRRLIIQAYRASAMRIPEGALDKKRAEIIEARYEGDMGKLREDLAGERLTFDDWKMQIEEQMIIGAMRQTHVFDNISVSPNDIRKEYEARREEVTRDTMPRVYIYAVEDGDDAAAALAAFTERLAAGEAFEALARESSVDAMADNGGDYGFINPDRMLAPLLAETVRNLKNGELSAPVKLGSRQYLILRKSPRALSHHEAIERVGAELREKAAREIHGAWIERLRTGAKIDYFL